MAIIHKLRIMLPARKRNKYFLFIAIAAVIAIGGYFVFTLVIDPKVLPQQAVHLLQDVTLPTKGQKVIIFSPHPDDESIAVGGYIAQSTKVGADVRIVLVTNGNKHKNEEVRYAEFKKAISILGVSQDNLVFMGLPDGGLSELSETTLSHLLKQQTDNYSPDIIIYPARQDFHPDHAAVGRVMDKIRLGYSNTLAYTYLVHYEIYYPHPKSFAPNLYLLPPSRLARFGNSWQKVMLSPAIEQLKQEAIYSYQSQFTNPFLKNLLLSSIRMNELLMGQ